MKKTIVSMMIIFSFIQQAYAVQIPMTFEEVENLSQSSVEEQDMKKEDSFLSKKEELKPKTTIAVAGEDSGG